MLSLPPSAHTLSLCLCVCVFVPISGIRTLQLVLLKMSLLLGVEVHAPVRFESLLEPEPHTGHYQPSL